MAEPGRWEQATQLASGSPCRRIAPSVGAIRHQELARYLRREKQKPGQQTKDPGGFPQHGEENQVTVEHGGD